MPSQLARFKLSRIGEVFHCSISWLKPVASGGPEIAFRGGRVDATGPNSPGVPEPQQDLDEHIASFARQGFTQNEMIGLVACGYVFPPASIVHI
jgi:hypothetical protein